MQAIAAMKNLVAPLLLILSPLVPMIATGIYEEKTGNPADVSLVTSMWTWSWLAGVIFGYFLWDVTRPLEGSGLRQWYRRVRKLDPLSFAIEDNIIETDGSVRSEIFALFYNDCDRRIEKACLTVEKEPCDGGEVEFIEYLSLIHI